MQTPFRKNALASTFKYARHFNLRPYRSSLMYLLPSQCLYALLLGWIISETIIKFGILLFYWRVFRGRYFRWSVWVVGTFFVACFMAGFFGFILQCVPVNGFWDRSEHAMCLKESPFFHATAALDLFGDIILFIQPLPIILRLKASRETRLGLCVVFLTGGL